MYVVFYSNTNSLYQMKIQIYINKIKVKQNKNTDSFG